MVTYRSHWRYLAVLVVLLVVSGCGRATIPSGGAATAPAETVPPAATVDANAPRYKIALVLGSTTDTFYISMQCGAQAKAAELGDVDLTVLGSPNWDFKQQVPIINSLVAQRMQAIAVVVNDRKELFAPLKAAHDAGIKILGVDTALEDTSFEVTNIASDNYVLGVEAAILLAGLIGDKGTVLTWPLEPGVTTVAERTQGFVDEITNNHPDISIVYLGGDLSGASIDVMKASYDAAFAAHPEITGVFATHTNASEAAAAALKDLSATQRQQVQVVSLDASPALVDALKDGRLHALVAQKPAEMGALAVEMARNALRGERVERTIPTGGVGLTKQNIDDPEFSQYIYRSSC